MSGSTLPLPKEKHEDSVSSKHTEENEELASDPGFDSLDLPEVPKVSVRTTADNPSAPEASPVLVKHSSSSRSDLDSEHIKSTSTSNEEPKEDNPDPSISIKENKQFQFIPFIASPPTILSSSKQSDTTPSFASHPSPVFPSKHSDPTESLPRNPSPPPVFPSKHRDPTPPLSHTKTEATVDLQDVLAAALAAAESADRAATAARAAASLAQVRISDLVTKRKEVGTPARNEKDGSPESFDPQDVEVNPTFDQQYSFGHTDHASHYDPAWGSGPPNLFTDDVPKMMDGSLDTKEHSHQPRRSTSLEDDPYFSYPNLFSRQDSGPKPDAYPSAEHSRPPHE